MKSKQQVYVDNANLVNLMNENPPRVTIAPRLAGDRLISFDFVLQPPIESKK